MIIKKTNNVVMWPSTSTMKIIADEPPSATGSLCHSDNFNGMWYKIAKKALVHNSYFFPDGSAPPSPVPGNFNGLYC